MFGVDHMYSKSSTTTTTTVRSPSACDSRKRERSSPTGKTPQQPSKIGSAVLPIQKKNIPWTEAEKEFFKLYVHEMPRGVKETMTEYWQKCSVAMNTKYPRGMRNGLSCKALSQRLFVTPSTSNQISSVASLDDTDIAAGFHMLSTDIGTPVTRDVETQTTLSFPVNTDRGSYKDGGWLFMEPKKQLQPDASVGADYMNRIALKRLRQYRVISDAEKARLIDVLCYGSSRQFARALMSSSLKEEVKSLFIYDIEMDARECSSKSSILCHKQYKDLKEFQWSDILKELVSRQSTLAEVLLAVALPTGKIGNTKPIEALCPVVGTIYGMLMMQRFHQLSAVQRFITATLANEQTHQKFCCCSLL